MFGFRVASWLLLGLLAACALGCQAGPSQTQSASGARPATSPIGNPNPGAAAQGHQSTPNPDATPDSGTTVAFLHARRITWHDLAGPLTEAAGGQVLAELVLEKMIDRELTQRGMKLDARALDSEERILIASLSDDRNQAQRLLAELRRRRGLGPKRYPQMLHRQAGLRLLVQDQVQVTDAALRQAYEVGYGPRWQARLIVVATLAEANRVVQQARRGENFIDLAVRHSTDASRAQGGLLSPISPADPSYPMSIRRVIRTLAPDQVSDPIAIDQGFAVLKLVRKIDAKPAAFDDVKNELSRMVQRRIENLKMQQTARSLLQKAELTILDPALHESWKQHRRVLVESD